MPTPSKFTAEVRTKIIQALSVGASRNTAAAIAGVDEAQVRRWIKKGEESAEGTRYREFYEEARKAEAAPRMRALGIIYKELPDNPALAWKYVERREAGYEPPMPSAPGPVIGPTIIQLSLSDGSLPGWISALDSGEVIEGEVVDESDVEPGTASPTSA